MEQILKTEVDNKTVEHIAYQLLFILSIGLFSSTEFLETGSSQAEINQCSFFLLAFFDRFSSSAINTVQIFAYLLHVIACGYVIITKRALFFLQFFQLIVYPVLAYLRILIMRRESASEDFVNYILGMTFQLISVILIIKQLKIQLRYRSSSKLEGYTQISSTLGLVFLIRTFLCAHLSIQIPETRLLHICFLASTNFILFYLTKHVVTYQNPQVEFISMMGHVYSWFSLLLITLREIFQIEIHFVINYMAFGLLVYVCLVKPCALTRILEIKYSQVLIQLKESLRGANLRNSSPQGLNNFIETCLFLDMYILGDSQPRHFKIHWSEGFKTELFSCFTKDPLQYHAQPESSGINGYGQCSLESAISLAESNRQMRNNQLTAYDRQKQRKVFLENLIWKKLLRLGSKSSKHGKQFRYFACFNFNNNLTSSKMKLFNSYFSNRHSKQSFFEQLEGEICYNSLRQLVEYQKEKPHHNLQKIGLQQLSGKNLKTVKLENQIDSSKKCCESDEIFCASRHRQIAQESELSLQILQNFHQYLNNESTYIQIVDELKHKKSAIISYHNAKYKLHKEIENLVSQYENLTHRHEHSYIIFLFMLDTYINKDAFVGICKLRKNIETYIDSKKALRHVKSKSRRSKINTSFFQTTLLSLKNGQRMTDPNQEELICVVSGVNSTGNILIASRKFKELMEWSGKNESRPHKTTEKSINDFMLIEEWRLEHIKAMSRAKLSEKPVDHLSESYFLLSCHRNRVLEVNFDFYFYLQYQTDLLLVLEINYRKVKSLSVKNSQNQILFQHPKSSVGQEGSDSSLSNLLDETRRVKYFETNFYVEKQIESNFPGHLVEYLVNARTIREINQEEANREEIEKENVFEELRFRKFKENFQPLNSQCRQIFVILSALTAVLAVGLKYEIESSETHVSELLLSIDSKQNIQNEFILYEIYSYIDLEMMLKYSNGQLDLTEADQEKLYNVLITSLLHVDDEIIERYTQSTFQELSNTINENLLDTHWIEGYNKSFYSTTLKQEREFFEILSKFVNTQKFKSAREGGQSSGYSSGEGSESNHHRRMLIEKRNSAQELKEVGSSSGESLDLSLNQIKEIIKIQSPLSRFDQRVVEDHIRGLQQRFDYFYGQNGVTKKLLASQKKQFERISDRKLLELCLLEIISFVIGTFIIIKTFNLYSQMFMSYQRTLNVSRKFFKAQSRNLKKFRQLLESFQRNQVNCKSLPQGLERSSESQRCEQATQKSILQSKNNLTDTEERWEFEEDSENSLKVGISQLICSAAFTFFMRVILIGLVFLASHMRYQADLQIIETYTRGLTQFSELNAQMINFFGQVIYHEEPKDYTQNQHGDHDEHQETHDSDHDLQEFSQRMIHMFDEIERIDSRSIFMKLFVSQQLQHQALYQNICTLQPEMACTGAVKQGYHGFLALKSEASHFLLKNYLRTQEDSHSHSLNKRDSKNLFDLYIRINMFLFISHDINEFSFNLLKERLSTPPDMLVFWIMLALFCLDICSGLYILNRDLSVFNTEYLRLANFKMLKDERAFQYYANQSNQGQTIQIDTDLNHKL